jgi:hypothetical protein
MPGQVAAIGATARLKLRIARSKQESTSKAAEAIGA